MRKGAPSNNTKRKTTIDDLPPENTIEIFMRLPVEILIRSTLVCKTWYSLIVNPNFISSQIGCSVSCCHKDAVLIIPGGSWVDNYCSLISADTGDVLNKFEIPFHDWSPRGRLRLIGSVKDFRGLYMWNPSIRKYTSFTSSSIPLSFHPIRMLQHKGSFAMGFGYLESTRDYRIVRVIYREDKQKNRLGKVSPMVEVFSLRMKAWRKIQNPIVPGLADDEIGTTVDSSVYWMDKRIWGTDAEEVCILSFDFNNEVFGKLKLPDEFLHCVGENENARFQLMKFEGSLSICVFNVKSLTQRISSHPCCIWIMSHEDDIVSWTVRYRVVVKEFGWPLNITRSGSLIMNVINWKSSGGTMIISCNLKSMRYKDLGFSRPINDKIHSADTSFVESLVMCQGWK